jgi:thiosulfate/3-mercaptopyruvate sulfurtransferase
MDSHHHDFQRLPQRPLALVLLLTGLILVAGVAPAQGSSSLFRVDYARPEILTDVAWLAEHLDDPTVRVVDARIPFEGALYEAAHIPGAVFADMFFGVPIMPPEAFAEAMGQLGIDDDTTVVIYDTAGGAWGARLWWALKLHGHDRAMMLNGGLRQWIMAGLPIETTAPTVAPTTFTPDTNLQWLATADEVRAAIEDPDVAIVDTLPLPVYRGDIVPYGRPGHIPTALSFPTPDTIDAVALTLMPAEALSLMLARLELDPTRRTVTYCGGGFYGAHGAFVLYLMGFDDVALYAGSLMDWTSDASNPMTTEP